MEKNSEKILSSLSELVRTCIRVSNKHPEIFAKFDYERIERARKVLSENSSGYDESQIPKQSIPII